MASCGNQLQFQRTMKQLKDATTPESKTLALTSLRRVCLEDAKVIKTLKDQEFCELCNSVINASIIENDKLHIEACRTLDIILPETRQKNFDFFQSILQINRKKRLKILISLSILKDETVATIASKMSILEFLNNCMQSIKTDSMTWLLVQNADNLMEIRKMESKNLTENEEYEEKIVENTLKLLGRLCSLSSIGLNVRQFDTLLMEKVVILAYMGLRRQRVQALTVLKEAVQNDLGVRVRLMQKELWDAYKSSLQNIYCKRMTLLVNVNDLDWAIQWETSIALIGTDLHHGSGLVNSLLKVEELAFKSADPNRRQAFISWKVLIDNFALNLRELATNRRIKLLCVPLNAKNSKTEVMVLTKLEVWWHLIYKVYPSIAECIDTVLIPFLSMCFGPFGDKPLFVQKTDTNVSLGKKFPKTQVFAIYTFMQLISDKENYGKISSPLVQDVLPCPVNNSVFESIHKIFIHCFGEIMLSLGLLSDSDITNKTEIYSILWDSLIQRIEEYDKMKVSMYKEVVNVIVELMKHRFYKIPMIRDFLFNKILKNFDSIANSMQFTKTTLMDLVQTFLQVDNFVLFTSDHYQSIETLLWHLIKPKDADLYYPQTMELMQAMLKILDDAKNCNSNMFAACEVWCILARIANKYIEDLQNINEGTCLQHNFKTIESIISFPFTHIFTNDKTQLRRMVETWIALYKQFDFQAELIVTVQTNEIMNGTSNMLIAALKKEKNCCDLAAGCVDGLLTTINYDQLFNDKEVPAIVQLLKDLVFQSLYSNSMASNTILKALNAFLLTVFGHSIAKTAQYLKIIEPAVNYMLSQTEESSFDHEIINTWSTIVGLFKKLQKSLDHELLTCYKKTIILAVLHLNKEVSSLALSILDLKETVDDNSKKVLEEVIHELEETSPKNNFEIDNIKEKSHKKIRSPHIKPIGSFLNRKGMSPSNTRKENGKENLEKTKVVNIEPDSQDFVLINTDVQLDVSRLTDHQKEMFKKRRDDIPALYNDLTVSNSQDSQELQQWFNSKTGKSPVASAKKINLPSNNNEAPKPTSVTTQHFKNIADVFNIPEKISEKSSESVKNSSPRAQTRKQLKQQVIDEDVSAIEDSQQVKVDSAPIVAKKLDFESREEFPADLEQQVSPSIIDNSKMRRRNIIEEYHGATVETTTDKQVRTTRRSLQPQQQRVTLRKFNSNEQLNTKRGRKRRNSESNSESGLTIVHEKRTKREETPEGLNNSGDSSKSNEENKTDIDGKKISKRQLTEMSRLKIDMRFEPLPSRRSAGKLIENAVSNTTDKKSILSKDNKSKEEKTSINSTKNETIQQASSTVKRRSMSKAIPSMKNETSEKETEKLRKDSAPKKPASSENPSENNKSTTRKSLHDKIEPIAPSKKTEIVAETQEETQIDDQSTRMEIDNKLSEDILVKDSESMTDDSESEGVRSSQDSDIVESSQEPSTNSKLDKMDKCFIKIKKVEVVHSITKTIMEEEQIEKELKELKEVNDEIRIIDTNPIDLEETTPSIISISSESEKSTPVSQESKKVESAPVKSSIPVSHISSPKSTNSRPFRSKVPLQGRAAQMLGLVTKQSLAEKLSSDASKSDATSADEVTVVPVSKRDKVSKENDKLSSPSTGSSSGGSRQEKMFSNMNNSMRQETCLSPSVTMFCNLRNNGERISPKLDKHEQESENGIASNEREIQNGSIIASGSDASPNGKGKKELPLLEWSNANPPSLTASPSASILKRMQEADVETPNRKKRVSFADPPVSREMGYEIMTESASPPKLEKLPSMRSPISRKESRKHAKLRLIQMDLGRTEKENNELSNIVEKKSTEITVSDETVNITTDAPMTTLSPKVMLSAVLSEISTEEFKIVEIENQVVVNTQDLDMFSDNNVITACNESLDIPKTSTQNDQNNSSIKLDSINLSNILQKSSDNQITCLEDTVDVDNLSSSIEATSSNLSDKAPPKSSSQQSADPCDTLPVTDSIFSNLPLSQETQNSVAQLIAPEALDSTLPVYPSLVSCADGVEEISADLVDPLFTDDLAKHLSVKSIRSVGDLAQLTERDVNRLPIKSPKLACVKKALSRYESSKKLTRTPEKRSPTPKSSTPLGNKSKDSKTKSDNNSFDDLMKNSSNNSDLPSINVSALYDIKRLRKRQSIDNSMQTSPVKRSRKNDEEACADLMDHCDDQFLFNAFVKRFNAGQILKGYKEKMGEQSEKELKKKTLDMLGLSIEDDSEASFKASTKSVGLQKVLQQLPKIYDLGEDFYNLVLKTYKKKLKDGIVDKFSTTELVTLLAKRLSQEKDKDDKESIPNSNDLKIILDNVSPDSIMDQILTRNELMSSEVLLNIVLENSAEKLSENTKQTICKTLTDKFDVCELADMYHKIIYSGLRKMQGK